MLNTIRIAKEVFTAEAEAINDLKNNLTNSFDEAIQVMKRLEGRVVITGMGKSGHIGKKIAATLASTGTPSFFMHPAEAVHGDLGMLSSDDVLIAISNSGESDEILKIISLIQSRGIIIISMTGDIHSTLAKNSNYLLNINIKKEACPLNLAPMSSTTVTLAMGDAIAAALMVEKNFKAENFAMYHPGGSLGRKLLTKVKDIMKTENLPIVEKSSDFSTIIEVMTRGKLGLCIVKEENRVVGIITDGDLRRALQSTDISRFEFKANDMMTQKPKSVNSNEMAIDAQNYMLESKINELLVIDNDMFMGVVQIYDMGVM
ncbi:MAG: Arabinose 5-phosphate isomerase (EC [uncultured Sulfurovum sp.]|uniref:Arabinose 5-phosphate isomerase (EC) n=1 Tax=uncultured Sulfurovum sp. TaxID=269237 RepID=A0A6S6UH72_9BACT|nr:MAG: Arabinose 5-phosphate isomerase (EC [uncultured Sulfurovum sp.]